MEELVKEIVDRAEATMDQNSPSYITERSNTIRAEVERFYLLLTKEFESRVAFEFEDVGF